VPSTCREERARAVNSGQPWHLPYRLWADHSAWTSTIFAGRQCFLSALGPHGIRNRWSSVGTSGHARRVGIPGHRPVHRYDLGRRTSLTLGSNPTSPDAEHPAPDARASGRFQEEGRLGITMLMTRDSPSIEGDVPGPDPARALPSKAVAGRGSLVGAAGGGLPCLRKVRYGGAPLPPRAGLSGPRLVHTPSEPSGSQRSPAVSSGGKPAARVTRRCGSALLMDRPRPETTLSRSGRIHHDDGGTEGAGHCGTAAR
jgi:hypothetical protein